MKRLRSGRLQQRVDHLAIHQAEVARVLRHREAVRGVEQPVEQAAAEPLERLSSRRPRAPRRPPPRPRATARAWRAPARACAAGRRRAAPPHRRGRGQARGEGGLLAEVARQRDAAEAGQLAPGAGHEAVSSVLPSLTTITSQRNPVARSMRSSSGNSVPRFRASLKHGTTHEMLGRATCGLCSLDSERGAFMDGSAAPRMP
jgi:hypothetical protein